MAGASLLNLLDDIASLLDDVALMSKLALKKTAGVVGDDLALNAQQVAGVQVDRELPVVWSVAKGSSVNKLILVPSALALSAFIPWSIRPLMMVGGAYLCYEGFEKLLHKWLHRRTTHVEHDQHVESLADPHIDIDIVALEKEKIRGAVRTDFVLSAEIIVLALGSMTEGESIPPLLTQLGVLTAVAVVMTIGVYGLVAGIIKLDDVGTHLVSKTGDSTARRAQRTLGYSILKLAPYFMRALAIAGTAAMFLVGGEILMHGVPALHHWVEELVHHTGRWATVLNILANGVVGVAAGAVLVGIMLGVRALRGPSKADPSHTAKAPH